MLRSDPGHGRPFRGPASASRWSAALRQKRPAKDQQAFMPSIISQRKDDYTLLFSNGGCLKSIVMEQGHWRNRAVQLWVFGYVVFGTAAAWSIPARRSILRSASNVTARSSLEMSFSR
jgi:hypothetical protein